MSIFVRARQINLFLILCQLLVGGIMSEKKLLKVWRLSFNMIYFGDYAKQSWANEKLEYYEYNFI